MRCHDYPAPRERPIVGDPLTCCPHYSGEERCRAESGPLALDRADLLSGRAGSTVVGSLWVSTAWVRDGEWQTLAFPTDEAGEVTDWDPVYCEHYQTRQAAVLGHEVACSALAWRQGLAWSSGRAKARPEGG